MPTLRPAEGSRAPSRTPSLMAVPTARVRRRIVPALPRPARILLGVAFVFALVAGLAVAGALAFERSTDGRVVAGVSVGGVDVAGLAPDEARAAVARVVAPPMSVAVNTGQRTTAGERTQLGRGGRGRGGGGRGE